MSHSHADLLGAAVRIRSERIGSALGSIALAEKAMRNATRDLERHSIARAADQLRSSRSTIDGAIANLEIIEKLWKED